MGGGRGPTGRVPSGPALGQPMRAGRCFLQGPCRSVRLPQAASLLSHGRVAAVAASPCSQDWASARPRCRWDWAETGRPIASVPTDLRVPSPSWPLALQVLVNPHLTPAEPSPPSKPPCPWPPAHPSSLRAPPSCREHGTLRLSP
uniref:Uncharacterized protein n=1 Tax=Pipistrellus kuhlii TaxID=59472 RepID=A0A7J7TVZ1_PIPKU|nr:hypothetical protein mPipKuh1_009230 [Pipistrellus kuhlii]